MENKQLNFNYESDFRVIKFGCKKGKGDRLEPSVIEVRRTASGGGSWVLILNTALSTTLRAGKYRYFQIRANDMTGDVLLCFFANAVENSLDIAGAFNRINEIQLNIYDKARGAFIIKAMEADMTGRKGVLFEISDNLSRIDGLVTYRIKSIARYR